MLYRTKLLLTLFIGLALTLTVACSSTTSISKIQCNPGFIQPPGTQKCINIGDIVESRINDPSPKTVCPEDWRRLQPKGFCLPKFSIIGCGSKTFACSSDGTAEHSLIPGTTEHRLIPFLPTCSGGLIIVSTAVALFEETGTTIDQFRTALACAGPTIGKPI